MKEPIEAPAHASSPDASRWALLAERVDIDLGQKRIVTDVSFMARFGKVTAIVGPNGAGKTTLVRGLAGLVPYSGSIRLGVGSSEERLEREVSTLRPEERACRLTYVPQRSLLNAALSVWDVVAMARFAQRPHLFSLASGDERIVADALRAVDAANLSHAPYTRLSGGEQRRVLLARALATGARIILLDEPSISLDVKHCLSLFARLRELAEDEYAVITVLHDLDDVQRFADEALLLCEGRLVASGPVERVVCAAQVEHVYDVTLVERDRVGYRLKP